MKNRALIGFALSLFFVAPAAWSSLMGVSDPYNALVFGDFTSTGTDTEGRIAAQGDVNLVNYSIGLKSAETQYSLVSGGNVTISSAGIQNGGIYADGNVALTNVGVRGDVTANGTITQNNGTVDGVKTASAGATNPVDFAAAYSQLSTTSQNYAAMSTTGLVDVKSWGSIYLSGGDGLNIFNITSGELAASKGMLFDLGDDASAVINVSGSSADFSGFGFFDFDDLLGSYVRMDANVMSSRILFNFFEADVLNMSAIGVIGSILAPDTNVLFNNGVLQGNLVAASFSGTGQINHHEFAEIHAVPEPSALLLFAAGLLGLLGFGRKQQA